MQIDEPIAQLQRLNVNKMSIRIQQISWINFRHRGVPTLADSDCFVIVLLNPCLANRLASQIRRQRALRRIKLSDSLSSSNEQYAALVCFFSFSPVSFVDQLAKS